MFFILYFNQKQRNELLVVISKMIFQRYIKFVIILTIFNTTCLIYAAYTSYIKALNNAINKALNSNLIVLN